MRLKPAATKWCHVTWSTARHRKCFNIAAQARFCEQVIEQECARHGWNCLAALQPNRIHMLVEVPAVAPRESVVSRLRDIVTYTTRGSGTATGGQVWENGGWCSVLTSSAAVEAVRRHVRRQAAGARP